jgi:exopolysaccharide biosynthesis polyprenyl glycosylphosphotransferase
MSDRREIPILVAADFITICLAWTLYFLFRVRSGLVEIAAEPDFFLPMVTMYVFWALVFFFIGLYRPWYASSRIDELVLLFKTITFGSLFLFFVIFMDDAGKPTGASSRMLIAIYWAVLLVTVSSGRMMLRGIQRQMLISGVGRHKTVIVGSTAKTRDLFDDVVRYPALGYDIIGFVDIDKRKKGQRDRKAPVLGGLNDLSDILERDNVKEVLIALDSDDHDRLLDIVAKCNGHKLGLKIMPDLYDIISGQARTNQIYGFPLIEISPQLMPAWEEAAKRMLDLMFSLVVLTAGLPVWLLVALLIKLESRGPVLYQQERVGRDGRVFNMIKFRSMYSDAERMGPRWAGKKDPRITHVGRILRQLHIDEIPQMINILKGDMSLIGPRPERPVFVQKLAKEIPLYMRRLKVRPGITGWAQVKHKYDESVDDVKKKVQYDLFYIENMSLRMDFKIILSTFSHMLLGRGR